MTNQAKKIESTGIVPTVGMILMPRSPVGNHKPCRIVVVGKDIDGLKVCRAGGNELDGVRHDEQEVPRRHVRGGRRVRCSSARP